MARTFDQVLADVNAQSDPQRQLILNQISSLPGQQAAEEQSLSAQKDQAYTDILNGARRRGLGFAGIPLGEQAQYNATNYAPAVAKLKQSYVNNKTSLESALNDIGSQNYMTAQNIYNQDRQFEEQQRQFNEQLAESRRQAQAAASANAGSYLSGLGAAQNSTPAGASMAQRASGGGFNFTNAYGNAISAAQYAATKGIPFRTLLQQMANAGDNGAKTLLGFVGNDYGYDPKKIGNNGNLYNAFVWGTGKSYNAPPTTYSTNQGIRVPNF